MYKISIQFETGLAKWCIMPYIFYSHIGTPQDVGPSIYILNTNTANLSN